MPGAAARFATAEMDTSIMSGAGPSREHDLFVPSSFTICTGCSEEWVEPPCEEIAASTILELLDSVEDAFGKSFGTAPKLVWRPGIGDRETARCRDDWPE